MVAKEPGVRLLIVDNNVDAAEALTALLALDAPRMPPFSAPGKPLNSA
jgi:hypothetical protein